MMEDRNNALRSTIQNTEIQKRENTIDALYGGGREQYREITTLTIADHCPSFPLCYNVEYRIV